MKKLLFLILLASVSTINSYAQSTIYVDSAATGLNNGTSWTNAYNSLSDALHYCWQTPMVDSVLVAKGTYSAGHRAYNMQPNRIGVEASAGDSVFHVRTGLVVMGGYNAINNLSNPLLEKCTLMKSVIIDSSDYWASINDTTVVNGFVLGSGTANVIYILSMNGSNPNGYTATAKKIMVLRATAKIINIKDIDLCATMNADVVIDNCAHIDTTGAFWPGWPPITIGRSNCYIKNSKFGGHKGDGGNSIIILNDSSNTVAIDNSLFQKDISCRNGGSIQSNYDGNLIVRNTVFDSCITQGCSSQSARYGGAIKTFGRGLYYFENNVFSRCVTSREGGAISIEKGTVYLINNVFDHCIGYTSAIALGSANHNTMVDTVVCINNLFSNNSGGLLCHSQNSYVVNNTFFQNSRYPQAPLLEGGALIFYNNLFTRTYAFNSGNPNIPISDVFSSQMGSIHNYFSNQPLPNFVDTSNLIGPDGIWMTADDGLNINGNSLAKNAGLNSAVPTYITLDIKGEPRIFDTIVDIGAYENQNFLTPPIINAGPASTATSQQLTAFPCNTFGTTHFGVNAAALSPTLPTAVVNPGSIICTYDSTTATFSFPTPAVGTYTLSVFFDYGSTITQTDSLFTVVAPALISLSIAASQNPICQGDPVLFTATATGATFPLTYQWKVNSTNVGTNAANYMHTNGSNTDIVQCQASAPSCILVGSVLSDSIILQVDSYNIPLINISSNPTIPILGTSTIFTANIPTTVTNYQINWYVNATYQSSTYSPTNTSAYTTANINDSVWCILYPSNGCFDPDSAISKKIGFTYPIGISETENSSTILLYPNPTSNELIIASQKESNNIQEIIVRDMVGKILLKENYNASKEVKLSLAHLANGQYHVLIKTTEGNAIRKVQVLR